VSVVAGEASLLSWNVAGRIRRLAEQQAEVIKTGADMICLQETTSSTTTPWMQVLGEAGWPYAATAESETATAAGRGRPLIALTASRAPIDVVELPAVPWPERVLANYIDGLLMVNVHSPTSPKPGLAKVLTHESIAAWLAARSGPRLVCGDLNTPRKEFEDGRIWTFARDRYGKLRADRGERWDQAELALIRGLESFGFYDAFRRVHGAAVSELSWEWQRWGGGYRLDHLIVSAEIHAHEVCYLHDWRQRNLSDHSALFARVSWNTTGNK
jgi:exonuclease III